MGLRCRRQDAAFEVREVKFVQGRDGIDMPQARRRTICTPLSRSTFAPHGDTGAAVSNRFSRGSWPQCASTSYMGATIILHSHGDKRGSTTDSILKLTQDHVD
jgi:hypothetical protein